MAGILANTKDLEKRVLLRGRIPSRSQGAARTWDNRWGEARGRKRSQVRTSGHVLPNTGLGGKMQAHRGWLHRIWGEGVFAPQSPQCARHYGHSKEQSQQEYH